MSEGTMWNAINAERARLQTALEELDARLERERQEFVASIKKDWRFTLTPVDTANETRRYLEVRDPAVRLYKLRGEVLNREELAAAGATIGDDIEGGAMIYLFNTATGRIIKSEGGGRVFIVTPAFASYNTVAEVREDSERVYGELERFLVATPDGGDVTAIILSQRHMLAR